MQVAWDASTATRIASGSCAWAAATQSTSRVAGRARMAASRSAQESATGPARRQALGAVQHDRMKEAEWPLRVVVLLAQQPRLRYPVVQRARHYQAD